MAELIGAAEIAKRLRLAFPNSVHNLRRRDASFPEPVGQAEQAMVWRWSDVEKWAKKTGRLDADGRPTNTPRRRAR